MKNTQTNGGSFAAAKLQAKRCSLLAIIAIAAVIGFSFISCDDSGGGGAKSIKITGIPNQYYGKLCAVTIYDDGHNAVAGGGGGIISGSSVTVDLEIFGTNNAFTGSGSYYVFLLFQEQGTYSAVGKYSYTNGGSLTINNETGIVEGQEKLDISNATTIVDLSLFSESL